MIIGECPHCDEPITLELPDVPLPTFAKITCESCGEWFWEKFSRIDPEAYLPEEIEVDEETKSIRIKE